MAASRVPAWSGRFRQGEDTVEHRMIGAAMERHKKRGSRKVVSDAVDQRRRGRVVQTFCRLVQQKQIRPAQQAAREGKAPRLPARQTLPALAQPGLQTAARPDRLRQLRGLQRRP